MMVEVVTLLLLAGAGWVVARLGSSTSSPAAALAAALPLGAALYVTVMTVLVALNLSLARPVIGLAVTAIVTIGLAGARWREVWDTRGRLVASTVVAGGAIVGVTAIARTLGIVTATPDSFRYVTVGGLLHRFGDVSVGSIVFLWEKRGLATGALHGLAGADHNLLAGLTPLVAFSALAVIGVAVLRAGQGVDRRVALLVAIGAVLLLLTIERFLFHAFYINSHMLVATWLLLLQLQVLRTLRGVSIGSGDLFLIVALGTGVVVARPEGPLLVGLVLLPALLDRSVAVHTRVWMALAIGLPTLAWNGLGLGVEHLARGETPPTSVLGLTALGVAAAVFAAFTPLLDRVPRPRAMLLWVHAALWGVLAIAAVRDPGILYYSVRATVENVLFAGGWGNSLVIIAMLLAVALAVLTWDGVRPLAFTLFTFVPMSLLLAYLRGGAFRIGPGDSLNRMLLHMVPIAVLALATSAFGEPRRWTQRWRGVPRAATPVLSLLLAMSLVTIPTAPATADANLPPGGTFVDDDGNVHEGNIETIAAAGVTRGCNPPWNDRYCARAPVQRGQMAAFLGRALDLPATSRDHFRDDDGSRFEGAINALAEAGITAGCNPPASDRFCPDRTVTRGQMAAFLRRAYGYPTPDGDAFLDDDGSPFEAAIEAIAAEGVTKGCNPPANDRFCPDAATRRDQMASFLGRAEQLQPTTPPPRGEARRVWHQHWSPFAAVGGVTLRHPSYRVERIGFHQANHDGARQLDVLEDAAWPVTMSSRGRGTGSRSAADIVVDPDVAIRSPVTGTVKRAGTYVLYCDYSDDFAVIEPDSHPGWEVKVLHIDGVRVRRGDRVTAGSTVVAPRPTRLPFRSQVDDETAEPSWPHVHLEVVDPSIPNDPGDGGGC